MDWQVWKNMRLTRRVGMVLLGAYLILHGLMAALQLSFVGAGVILGILAILAGLCMLVEK
ncbi:MAG: hypothetical protein EXR98_20590 [Gemmataceae bacterium]|nr:hypothetical protein [Gemmataceae bacterium]